ncbi:MAG: c-type cytochrome domain-containing protein, partial [Planctomycetota bacterium]
MLLVCLSKRFVPALFLVLFCNSLIQVQAQNSDQVSPAKIRSILSENCFQCHGPDAKKRAADLRFDTKEGAFADLDGHKAIVPGDVKQSELITRITSTDADLQMPPAESGKKLTPEEIALLNRWIQEGAVWQDHWSFVTPKKTAAPAVKQTTWARTPVDQFILSRLEKEGLLPSPEADRRILIRRVTLDLTGLPPKPEDVEAFVNDQSP